MSLPEKIKTQILINKTIFLISPEPWDYISVSKHHYAIALAGRGNKVYFINPPLKQLVDSIVIQKVSGIKDLFVVSYWPFAKGLRFLPGFIMHYIERKFLKKIEKKIKQKFDVVWNFENSRYYDFRFASSDVLKIYFQVDENQDFHPAIAARTADIVFAINDDILKFLRPYNSNSYKIGHSFQGALSAQAQQILDDKYTYAKPETPLQVMYVGNLDNMYIDHNLFEEVISKHPEVNFLLVGPYSESGKMYSRIKQYANVKFLGKKPSKEIPELLSTADLLILMYGTNFTTSSHKLLEYLASGKAIVCTYMSEFENQQDLIKMSKKHSEFEKTFFQALYAIEELNTPRRMKSRIQFALDNTYSKQLDRIDEVIQRLLSKRKK